MATDSRSPIRAITKTDDPTFWKTWPKLNVWLPYSRENGGGWNDGKPAVMLPVSVKSFSASGKQAVTMEQTKMTTAFRAVDNSQMVLFPILFQISLSVFSLTLFKS